MNASSAIAAPAGTSEPRPPRVIGPLAIFAVLAIGIGLVVGAFPLPIGAIASTLVEPLGLSLGGHAEDQAFVLWHVRLPRVVLGALVGASLGVCGAMMQGLFRNPLAEPALVGVGAGAALGAASMIVFGGVLLAGLPDLVTGLALPLAAFVGGAGATWIVHRAALIDGRISVDTMLLAGIAINAIGFAGIGLLQAIADDAQLRSLTFWMLGSMGNASWSHLAIAGPLMMVPVLLASRLARGLDALLLGENEARHLGVDVGRLERISVGLGALGVGAAVALCGMIGFVGLVVPHIVRKLAGPGHRTVLVGSVLLGAGLLVLADAVARTITAPAELPVGVFTSLVGAPFFLALLRSRRLR